MRGGLSVRIGNNGFPIGSCLNLFLNGDSVRVVIAKIVKILSKFQQKVGHEYAATC